MAIAHHANSQPPIATSCRAQFVLVMLVLFTLTLPLLVLAYVPNSPLAVVLTVVTVATYWTVNEVARDVEDPFLYGELTTASGEAGRLHPGKHIVSQTAVGFLCVAGPFVVLLVA